MSLHSLPHRDLAAARLVFRSPDPVPLDVLCTAAAVLRQSQHPDDQTIAREWGAQLARDFEAAEAERRARTDEYASRFLPGWWIAFCAIGGAAVYGLIGGWLIQQIWLALY